MADHGPEHAAYAHTYFASAVQAAAATDKPVILVSEKLGSAGKLVLPLLALFCCSTACLHNSVFTPLTMCRFEFAEPVRYSRLQL